MASSADGAAWLSGSEKAQTAFILGTVVQIFIFIYAPELYADAAPELAAPHFVFFRLIGVLEVGLMSIYAAGVVAGDHYVTAMTVVGRFCVVPFMLVMVVGLGGPPRLLLGVLQDVAGASATLYFLRQEWASAKPRPLCVGGWEAELLVRVVLLIGAFCDLREAVPMFAYPLTYCEEPIVSDPELTHPPVFVGYRSYAFGIFLLGCYQLAVAVLRAPPVVYFATGFYHFVNAFLVAHLGTTILEDPVLDAGINPKVYHFLVGLGLMWLTLFLAVFREGYEGQPPGRGWEDEGDAADAKKTQ